MKRHVQENEEQSAGGLCVGGGRHVVALSSLLQGNKTSLSANNSLLSLTLCCLQELLRAREDYRLARETPIYVKFWPPVNKINKIKKRRVKRLFSSCKDVKQDKCQMCQVGFTPKKKNKMLRIEMKHKLELYDRKIRAAFRIRGGFSRFCGPRQNPRRGPLNSFN